MNNDNERSKSPFELEMEKREFLLWRKTHKILIEIIDEIQTKKENKIDINKIVDEYTLGNCHYIYINKYSCGVDILIKKIEEFRGKMEYFYVLINDVNFIDTELEKSFAIITEEDTLVSFFKGE